MPRFFVKDSFALTDKNTFVLAGFIIEGGVSAGMIVRLPFNTKLMLTVPIDRVEFIRRPDGDVVCLCIECAVPKDVVFWEALKVRNQMIELTLPT